jgi:hypothetical protein
MKRVAVPSILTALVLLALGVTAEAQQPAKTVRIGFLDPSTASGIAVLLDVFRQELSKLGWVEGRISPSNTDLPSKRMSVCLSLPRSWFVLRLI